MVGLLLSTGQVDVNAQVRGVAAPPLAPPLRVLVLPLRGFGSLFNLS